MTTNSDDHDEHRRRSRRLLGVNPVVENDQDDNPPPPDETQPDLSQPLLTPIFTVVARTHEGRTTTSPRGAIFLVDPPTPSGNRFEQLGQDDATTINTGDAANIDAAGNTVDIDVASTTSSTARQIADLARAMDLTIEEINAIPTTTPPALPAPSPITLRHPSMVKFRPLNAPSGTQCHLSLRAYDRNWPTRQKNSSRTLII
jgi:hypothetical protein